MKQALSISRVNQAIQRKYPDVFLVKGKGYFYIVSDNDETALKIAGLYTSSIPVCHLKHQTVEQWVKDVEDLLNQNIKIINLT